MRILGGGGGGSFPGWPGIGGWPNLEASSRISGIFFSCRVGPGLFSCLVGVGEIGIVGEGG